jgi:hypothetical protein
MDDDHVSHVNTSLSVPPQLGDGDGTVIARDGDRSARPTTPIQQLPLIFMLLL